MMEKMKNFLWYSLKTSNILLNLGVIFGTFLFGCILHDIMILTVVGDEPDFTTFPMGILFACMGLLFIALFANWADEIQMFTLSVSMGSTRKAFFTSFALQYFAICLIDWVFAFLLCKLEEWRLAVMYPGHVLEISLSGLFHPVTFIVVPLFMTALGLLIGGLGLRFGSNSRWIVAGIWIVICIGVSRIGNGSVLAKLAMMPSYGYIIIFAVVTLIMLGVAIGLMRKQRVDV